jgi:hypothetical protein
MWENGAAACWDTRSGSLSWSEVGDRFATAYFSVSFSQDGTRALIVGHSGNASSLKLVDVSNGRHVMQWQVDPGDPVMAGAFVKDLPPPTSPANAAAGDVAALAQESILFTRSSLLRERLSIQGGRRFARRQELLGQAAEVFAERMRTWSDQKTNSGLLTLYSDVQPVDKKERVFDQMMGDPAISDDVKDALVHWLLEAPAEGGRGS